MWRKIGWAIVILFVFCFGVKYGELKSYSYMMQGGSYGYGMMNWGIKDGNKFYRMMPWADNQQEINTDSTTTPKTQ